MSRCLQPVLLAFALALGVVMPGCNLFKAAGAACQTDGNCPSDQVCCGGVCSTSCGESGGINASVSLATDYVPGYEFDAITIDVETSERQTHVNVVTELVTPRPVGQFSGVTRGDHAMTLTLSLAGVVVATRTISFNGTSDITVPFVMTHDCAGVSCTGDANQCLGKQCVPSACSGLNPGACPSPACMVDSDCAAISMCSIGVCISGVCMQRRNDALCQNDERCIPDMGCVAQHDECDSEEQCNDLVACTLEQCVDQRCSAVPDDTRCGTTVCDPTAKTANPMTGCAPAPCSPDNCIPGPCETATCEGGQCQHATTCHSNEHCCGGVCGIDCNDPRPCATRAAGDVCRVAVGTCDIPELCTAASDACPADNVQSQAYPCRPALGPCDIAESCDGASGVCPADTLVTQGTVCRPLADVCDVAEVCTGQSSACPFDMLAQQGTICRAVQGICDVAEACTGVDAKCPVDTFVTSSTVCRASVGGCDLPENCTGASAACPADTYVASGIVCRQSAGACDPTEACDGKSPACPTDAYYDSSHICHASTDPTCDAAKACTGTSPTCPATTPTASGTACGSDTNTCVKHTCNGAGACVANTQPDHSPCGNDNCSYCSGTTCLNCAAQHGGDSCYYCSPDLTNGTYACAYDSIGCYVPPSSGNCNGCGG